MGSQALQGQFLRFADPQVLLGRLILGFDFPEALHFAPLRQKTASFLDFTQSEPHLQYSSYFPLLLPRTKQTQKKHQIPTHSELIPTLSLQEPFIG